MMTVVLQEEGEGEAIGETTMTMRTMNAIAASNKMRDQEVVVVMTMMMVEVVVVEGTLEDVVVVEVGLNTWLATISRLFHH